jgi:TIR domain
VVFISAEYAERDWTRLERQAALARAVRERREYVLPARFDDTPLPGLLPDVVAIDLRRYAPAEFAGLVEGKLADLGIGASAVAGTDRAPAGAVRVSQAGALTGRTPPGTGSARRGPRGRPSPAWAGDWRGAARRPHAAARATPRPWKPTTGRAGPASCRAGRR